MNNETMKPIMFWTGLVIAIGLVVAGMIWLVSLQSNQKQNSAEVVIENVIYPEDWTKGNKNAKVILAEYSDFQCPACASYSPLINAIAEEYKDQIIFAYRHFPLPGHLNSIPMTYASEAAGKQGKFWEMHDMIFENQSKWTNEKNVDNTVIEYAKKLGLNVEQFTKDFKSDEIKKKIADLSLRSDMKVITYTPTFFLNGKRINNPKSYIEIKSLIDEAIKNSPAPATSPTTTSTTTPATSSTPKPSL